MALFDLPISLRDRFGGSAKLDVRQMLPQTSAVSGVRPGVGAASGITTFQFTDGLWFVPSLSYFQIRGHFLDGSGNALARPPVGQLGYVDNWPAVLFQTVQAFINSESLELLQNSPQADTALQYSSVDRTFLKSFASSAGLGESLQTRILNSAQFGVAAVGATNYNEVVACFRPALSIFDCPNALPPGPMHRFDFSWSNTGEQNMVESITSKLISTDFTFTIDEFSFYKVCVVPDASVQLPTHALIELNPVQVQTYPMVGGATLQPQIPLPPNANRILVVMQEAATSLSVAAGTNGLKPITDFHSGFAAGGSDAQTSQAFIQNAYISYAELGTQAPNPTYTFTGLNSAGAKSGYERAYQDWCMLTRGSSGGSEGSVPLGNADQGVGAAIIATALTTPLYKFGNPENDQQFWLTDTTTTVTGITAATAARTAMYGYMGRKFIMAFPLVKPQGVRLSQATLFLQFTAAVTAINVYVIISYNKALAIEFNSATGRYDYRIVNDY